MHIFKDSAIDRVWKHTLEDGTGELTCFSLEGVDDHAFWLGIDVFPLLEEAVELRTLVRVMASEPEIVTCDDPHCGDGCCDDPDCTNVPEGERTKAFLLRADTIEWL